MIGAFCLRRALFASGGRFLPPAGKGYALASLLFTQTPCRASLKHPARATRRPGPHRHTGLDPVSSFFLPPGGTMQTHFSAIWGRRAADRPWHTDTSTSPRAHATPAAIHAAKQPGCKGIALARRRPLPLFHKSTKPHLRHHAASMDHDPVAAAIVSTIDIRRWWCGQGGRGDGVCVAGLSRIAR